MWPIAFLAVVGSLLITGCQTVNRIKEAFLNQPPQTKKMVIEKSWTRSTLRTPWPNYRRSHRMTPVIFEDLVIAGNAIDGIAAYKRGSGAEVWRKNIDNGVEGGAQVYDDKVFFASSDGHFYALEARTGHVLWTFPIRFEGLAAPTIKNGRIYVLVGNNTAYALEAATGKQLWLYNRKENLNLTIRGGSQPLVLGDSVILGFSDGYLVSLNSSDGGLQWERQLSTSKQFTDVDSTPVLDGDHLLISSFDGTLYSLTRNDGQVVWRYDEGGFGKALVDGERVYYATVSDKLVALNRNTGAVNWQVQLPKGQATSPILYQGYLVIVQNGGPIEIRNPANGDVIANFFTGRGSAAIPLIIPNTGELYVLTLDANLFSFVISRKSPQELNSLY